MSDVILFRCEGFNEDYCNRFQEELSDVLGSSLSTEMEIYIKDLADYLTQVTEMKGDELFPWRITTDVLPV